MNGISREKRKVAIIGGGVIGAGWAARFLLHGWDASVYEPNPIVQRRLTQVLRNARDSLPKLCDVPMPCEGVLTFSESIEQAVLDASWVQESVPERLTIKQEVFAEIQAITGAGTILCSSTSGFRPSDLQEVSSRPEQLLVAHPFNPVYLLPLVEVVASDLTCPVIAERAKRILIEIGMKPLVVRKEIEAHIADRLLEAVWREALWLVHDDVATTSEIDDAIRYGFGLRWAQMGLFETYRLAGGDEGMEQFVRQFGPALKWPWTKLMDVPELDEELIRKIVDQSEAGNEKLSIAELERIRDDNLVAILLALKERRWAAGQVLRNHELRIADETQSQQHPYADIQFGQPGK